MIIEDEHDLRGEGLMYHVVDDPVVLVRDPATIHEFYIIEVTW